MHRAGDFLSRLRAADQKFLIDFFFIPQQKFAMLEMKSTISKVLRHFQLKVSPDFRPIDVLELITKSSNGIWLELENRVYP